MILLDVKCSFGSSESLLSLPVSFSWYEDWEVFFFLTFVATIRVAGSLQKSTEVMTAMQNLVRLTDVSDTMRELSKEMMKVLKSFY